MKKNIEIFLAIILGASLISLLGTPFSVKERRFTIYNIMKELDVGINKNQINLIISRHNTPFLHRTDVNQDIILRVDLGIFDSCLLSIKMKQNKLVSASIRGEDGPQDYFQDAPQDLK